MKTCFLFDRQAIISRSERLYKEMESYALAESTLLHCSE